MRIEDDRGRQPGQRGPGAGPAAHHDRPAGAGLLPRAAGRAPAALQPCRQAFRPTRGRDEHQHAPLAGAHRGIAHHSEHEIDRVGERRLAHDRDAGLRKVESIASGRYSGEHLRRRHGQRAHDGRRGGDAEEERGRPGPTPGRPLRHLDQGRRRTPPQPRLEGEDVDAGRRSHVLVDHPAPHRPPVERRPHPRADVHVLAPGRRHGVIERLGHGGHLGAHAYDAHRVGGTTVLPHALIATRRRLPSGERPPAQSPKAVRRSSTRGVASHVNSFSERPK